MSTCEEIQQLIYRYCHVHDARDPESVAQCYARNAAHLGWEGRAAVRDFYASVYSTSSTRRRHVVTNILLLEETEDTARAVGYEQLYHIRDDKPVLQLTGLLFVDAVREDGEWKIQRVAPELDVPYDPGDTPQVGYELTADGRFGQLAGRS